MAIRPADLQLAYLAAPQNAAQVNSAQTGPQSSQAAAQAAFAAQVQHREETVAETAHAEGSVIRANPDGSNAGGEQQSGKRRRKGADDADGAPGYDLGAEEHFIDVTA